MSNWLDKLISWLKNKPINEKLDLAYSKNILLLPFYEEYKL